MILTSHGLPTVKSNTAMMLLNVKKKIKGAAHNNGDVDGRCKQGLTTLRNFSGRFKKPFVFEKLLRIDWSQHFP